MSISDIENGIRRKRLMKETVSCLIISVLLIIFNAVYTYFGYGEYSLHMRYMFLLPLVLGIGVSSLFLLFKKHAKINRVTFNLWNAGIGTVVVGCTVQGIINISGRYTTYGYVYLAIGSVMFIASAVTFIYELCTKK